MTIDVLPTPASPPARESAPSRGPGLRWAVSALVVLLVLGLVTGVTVAVRSLSGGGAQPEDALPGGAFAFAKVDLDPPAGQKIDAVRFLRKFPALRDKVRLDGDLREDLFEEVAASAGWDDITFDEDVAPWLGQRVGVAAYAPDRGDGADGGGSPGELEAPPVPRVVAAVQVTDAGKARSGLRTLIERSGAPAPGLVVQDGYALLAEDQATADKAARDARAGVLADDRTFAADVESLGDGVAAAWVDMDAAQAAAGVLGLAAGGALGLGPLNPAGAGGGRTTYVLRFDGADALEVRGSVVGATALPGAGGALRGFGALPDDSVVAFGLTGGDEMVPRLFESLRTAFDSAGADAGAPEGGFDAMVAEAEAELGIELPEDLAVLLGSNLVGAVGPMDGREPEIGARVTTDAERATAVLERLRAAAAAEGEDLPVVHRRTDDGVVVASTRAHLERLATGGGLGARDDVRAALPDLEGAGVALWVDVRGLATGFSGDGGVDENLDVVAGVGLTVHTEGDGAARYRLRLVTR